eukprot:TRINITY_DN5940_c0_g1_i1.p1 TRINITY_DN5940_c0_g1~~TRINITY_DN5940_c0_g1_i1.p1  ORF type:complete len:1275 (-),score=349.80 TRINITY_DN5940_c0_g1_i1:26-3850(-)
MSDLDPVARKYSNAQTVRSFIEAIKINSVPAVSALQDDGFDIVAARFWHNCSGLHLAAACGSKTVVKYLFNSGLDINAKDSAGDTPLSTAAKHGEENIALKLLKHGADILNCTSKETTLVHLAVRTRLCALLRELLKRGLSVDALEINQVSPLQVAAASGMGTAAEILLDAGANINAVMVDGRTAIHLAVQNGHEQVIRLLIRRQCDVYIKDCKGYSCADLCPSAHVKSVLAAQLRVAKMTMPVLCHNPVADALYCDEKTKKEADAKQAEADAERDAAAGVTPMVTDDDDDQLKVPAEIVSMLVEARKMFSTQNHRPGVAPTDIDKLVEASGSGNVSAVAIILKENSLDVNVRNHRGATALHSAAFMGDSRMVKFLLDAGGSVFITDNEGSAPLHCAAMSRLTVTDGVAVIRLLLDYGAEINQRNGAGWTPLKLAARRCNAAIINELLLRGADVNVCDEEAATALHNAAATEGKDAVKNVLRLLKAGAQIDAPDHDGGTPLIYACRMRMLDTARVLIAAGADVNRPDNFSTPLYHAVRNCEGKTPLVEMLLDAGAVIDVPNKHGYTPLQWASFEDMRKVALLLMKHGADIHHQDELGRTPLTVAQPLLRSIMISERPALSPATDNEQQSKKSSAAAVAPHAHKMIAEIQKLVSLNRFAGAGFDMLRAVGRGDVRVVTLLLEKHQVNVDFKDSAFHHGGTAAHFAVSKNNVEMLKVLCDHGADVNLGDNGGDACLHIAAHAQDADLTEILRLLVLKGALVNLRDDKGWTPLKIAVKKGHLRKVELLLRAGADPNIADEEQHTALHNAVSFTGDNYEEITKLLIKSGASINAPTSVGVTPLIAALKLCPQRVQLLLNSGANPNIPTLVMASPLFMAVQLPGDDTALTQLLVAHGANANFRNQGNFVALHACVLANKMQRAAVLLNAGADVNVMSNDGTTPLTMAKGPLRVHMIKHARASGQLLKLDYDTSGFNAMETRDIMRRVAQFQAQCEAGNIEAVTRALDEGMKLEYNLGNGMAVHYAAKGNRLEILSLLKLRGANMNARNGNGDTPLLVALANDRARAAMWLLHNGVNFELQNNVSQSALHVAIMKQNDQVVQWLLDHRCLQTEDRSGWSPIHLAAKGNLRALRKLIARGARVLQTKPDGWTALHLTAANDQADAAVYLLQHGARIDAQTRDGETPLDVCASDDVREAIIEACHDLGLQLPEKTKRQQLLSQFGRLYGEHIESQLRATEEQALYLATLNESMEGKLHAAMRAGYEDAYAVRELTRVCVCVW